jgi:flagellar basal body-associated protein FliL
MTKKDKKFNLKGLLLVIIIVNVFLALVAAIVDYFV